METVKVVKFLMFEKNLGTLCPLRFVIEFLQQICNTNGCLSVSSSEPAIVISMFKEICITNLRENSNNHFFIFYLSARLFGV